MTQVDSLEKVANELLTYAAYKREQEAHQQQLGQLQAEVAQLEAELAELKNIQIQVN